MKKIMICLTCLFVSCTLLKAKKNELRNNTKNFTYTDSSGTYQLERKLRFIDSQIVMRSTLKDSNSNKELEKTTTVSKIGQSKNRGSALLLPKMSQHRVWFDQKMYYSKQKLNPKSKKVEIFMKSPEKKWSGLREYKVPESKYFCWFSQIPECLNKLDFLTDNEKPMLFYTIWGGFPYHSEQLSQVKTNQLFAPSYIKFDSIYKGFRRYEVNIAGQTLFYFFDKNYVFRKMFWISQGISILENE